MGQLNKHEAALLFSEYAFWVGEAHVIPEETAKAILSDAAVKYMKRTGKGGVSFNLFTVENNKTLTYLTFKGFLEAVSYHNVELYFSEPRAVILTGGAPASRKKRRQRSSQE